LPRGGASRPVAEMHEATGGWWGNGPHQSEASLRAFLRSRLLIIPGCELGIVGLSSVSVPLGFGGERQCSPGVVKIPDRKKLGRAASA